MTRYNFTLSPSYVTRGQARILVEIPPTSVPVSILATAVMLATTIFAIIWFG